MRKIILAAGVAGACLMAAPAFAGPGQCYDAYGRAIGPVYDTDHPNYGFINSVIRRGGSCTGVVSPPSRPGYRYDRPDRPYYYRGYRNYDDNYRYYR